MSEQKIEVEYQEVKRKVVPIKVYPKIDVDLSYQNFGSAWLCILRGSTENIESVYNGLYNFCATNGKEPSYRNASQTCAVFWSDKKSLRRFFFNQHFIPRFDVDKICDGKTIRAAMRHAKECIKALRETGHEFFIDFSHTFELDAYSVGQVKAEKPDSDFRDAVLTHAFKDKSFNNEKTNQDEMLNEVSS